MLLNILRCTEQPPSTTNHPAANVSGAEVEKCRAHAQVSSVSPFITSAQRPGAPWDREEMQA